MRITHIASLWMLDRITPLKDFPKCRIPRTVASNVNTSQPERPANAVANFSPSRFRLKLPFNLFAEMLHGQGNINDHLRTSHVDGQR
jgi:hypothetical protein